jgi:hypothetical protein
MVTYLAVALVGMASVACSAGEDTSGKTPSTSTPRLANPLPGFRRQCEDAAASLGFPVPCPKRLPLVSGKPIGCSGLCVATAGSGETLDRIFFLNVEGYDGGPSSETVHHLIVEARRIERAPPSPCYGGVAAGKLKVNRQEVTLLDCPPLVLSEGAMIAHGEGAHAGHLLGYWDEGGIRDVVSVHGSTKPHRRLLRQLVASIEIIEP